MTEADFRFSTLNFWRKLYVILVWIFVGGLGASMLAAPLLGQRDHLPVIMGGGVLLIIAAWLTHAAVCQRLVRQQIAVLILNLACANIVGALIMLSIIRVTKRERTGVA